MPRPPSSLLLVALLTLLGLAACSGADDQPLAGGSGGATREPTGSGPMTYVALGDSFTAAPGVPPQLPGPCGRSSRNYPHVLADELDADLVDVSCGGADTTHVRTPQPLGEGSSVPPQLDAVTPDADLVTIGLGGNDLGLFARLLRVCLTGSGCTQGAAALQADLPTVERRVLRVVRAVRAAAPEAEVVVVGYPQLVGDETCERLPMAAGDLPAAREVNAGLADAVERAAEAGGARYVDLLEPSEGHDICSADPWVNGFDLGAEAAPFHPFASEQEAVAELVADAVG